jgi:ADP-ribose pyrophosphatase YjhB (NUDIX family)
MFLRILYLGYKAYCFLFRPIRVGVRVMMVEGDKIWLIRHTYVNGWFLPGGGVKRREMLEHSARREAWEETGAELGNLNFIGVYSSFVEWKTDHTAVFHSSNFKFVGKSDAEIAEMRLFPLNELPAGTYSPHRRLLEKFQAGGKQNLYGEW